MREGLYGFYKVWEGTEPPVSPKEIKIPWAYSEVFFALRTRQWSAGRWHYGYLACQPQPRRHHHRLGDPESPVSFFCLAQAHSGCNLHFKHCKNQNQNKNQKPPFPIRLLKTLIGSWNKSLFQVIQEMKRRFCIKDREFPEYCQNKLNF